MYKTLANDALSHSSRSLGPPVFVITLVLGFLSVVSTKEQGFRVRQAVPVSSTSTVGPAPATATAAATAASGTIQTLNYPPIGVSMAPSTMTALPATYTQGTASPIQGGPRLGSSNLKVSSYPALDMVPPVDSPQVKEWLSQIDMTKIPTAAPNGLNGCLNSTNANAVANAGPNGNCWWTCGGCTRNTDVVSCPDVGTWGASFDDGPSPETPRLLEYLDQQKLKSTFFVVGSRVLSRPQMLQYEYEAKHQISVHTWSHPYLTTLTNEQIVAELGWTKKVIHDTLGVTPNTMRPPYGDIDDRVRYIALAMGLTPIIWTTAPDKSTYDTEDWKIAAGTVTAAKVLSNFQKILSGAPTLPTGFIVLAHDLYPQSVALAVEFVLPSALSAGNLSIMPIISCLGQPLSEAYVETSAKTVATTSGTADQSTSHSGTASSAAQMSRASPSAHRDKFYMYLVAFSALLAAIRLQ